MLKKVSVKDLKVGIYIQEIDQGWLSSPFLFNKFKIKSQDQIRKLLDSGIREVTIDTQKGLDVAPTVKTPEDEQETVEYFSVSIDRFSVSTVFPCDLYFKRGEKYERYFNEGVPFRHKVLEILKTNNIDTLYVPLSQKEALEKYDIEVKKAKELSAQGLAPGFETPEKVAQYNNYLNNYMPINSSILFPGLKVPINIFKEKDTLVSQVHKAESEIPENEIFCAGTNGNTKDSLLIHINDSGKYKAFLKDISSGKITGNSVDAAKLRVAVLKENSKLVTRELMSNPRSGEAVEETKDAVTGMIENILENPTSFLGLMKINTYDYYTYLHSINVCTLATGLGMVLNLSKKELFNLAMGAMMHDVGKSKVPSQLINKPGKLTDEEFVQVKNHVIFGAELLKDHDSLSVSSLIPLSQHHEKLNGMGYPNRLEGEQVHQFGRICSIVDVYDALTTERAYKKAFMPFDAVSLLAKNPDEFDRDIFRQFVSMLGKQQLN